NVLGLVSRVIIWCLTYKHPATSTVFAFYVRAAAFFVRHASNRRGARRQVPGPGVNLAVQVESSLLISSTTVLEASTCATPDAR
ncbi:hypothetical protein ABLN72_04485, partial [Mycobacterium tuberculosis]